MTTENLNTILATALRMGIIDIFTVITYQVNGVTSDLILADLVKRIDLQRAAPQPSL